jgi:hypothetical protein
LKVLQSRSFPFIFLKENIGLVIPWMLGLLTFMSLEAVATVYANILRDHINDVSTPSDFCVGGKKLSMNSHSIFIKHFDGLCKAEVVSRDKVSTLTRLIELTLITALLYCSSAF